MGGFNSLPPELQHEVLFSCDSETLVACCQSAQCLLEVSRAVLYHSIRLDDDKATRLVANALKHAHHIRHLHAVTTDDSAYEGSWITLFTALKTAGVLESLNTIPPTTEWSRWSPKMIAALDDLSELTSIRSFKANSPRGAWTWASLARWGARLKGLRLLDNYIPFSEDQEIRAINPHLHTLHIEQLCEPSAYPCSIRFVRCLSLLLDRNGVWSEKEESIYQANLQTAAEFLDILSISWHWDQGKGPTLRGFNTPLPSLRTLALLYSNKGFMGPSKSYIQQISSVAPLILHLKIFYLWGTWNASTWTRETGGAIHVWDEAKDIICAIPTIKTLDLWFDYCPKYMRQDSEEEIRRLFPEIEESGGISITWDAYWHTVWPFFDL